jgi:hypothetical protein
MIVRLLILHHSPSPSQNTSDSFCSGIKAPTKPGLLRPPSAHIDVENRLSDYKHVEADEKELEKQEDESERDQPGEYQAIEVVDKKLTLTRRKKTVKRKKTAKRSR